MAARTIHRAQHNFGWDNSFEPAIRVAPGEALTFEVTDASSGQFTQSTTSADVPKLDFARVNPVVGPVFVEGAQPGDALLVEILDLKESGWGWTAAIPGFGLLADDFPDPAYHLSRYSADGVEFEPGIRLPFRPFAGTMGLAPAEPGLHSIVPPRDVGGNMDIRDLTIGARLWLPVQVPGALFSVGDTHAAQGDGEVCGTAVETSMDVHLRFDLVKQANFRRPRFEIGGSPTRHVDERGYYVTTGIGPDLMDAAKDAVRDMIDHLGREYGLDPVLAYLLCSVAVDLRISEIVDQPNWIIAAYLPKAIFV